MVDDLRDEVLRLRDRMHEVESKLYGLEMYSRSFRDWRKRVDPIIEDLRDADRIAEAIAKRMKETRQQDLSTGMFRLTKWQARAAVAAVFIAACGLFLNALSQIGVI